MPKTVQLNASVSIVPKSEKQPLQMTQAFAKATIPVSGETVEIVTSFPVPSVFILRGEKLVGTIDIMPLIQEALLHVDARNAE